MAVVERQTLDTLRSEVQRKLAAQIDLGASSEPPEPEPVAPQGVERRRMDNLRAEARRSVTTHVERRRLSSFLPGTQRGWRLRPARFVLLFVALVAGGLAAYLATQHEPVAPPAAPQPIVAAAPAATTKVLVAKQTVEVGQKLTPALLEWQDWPQDALRPEYITAATAPGAMTDMSGSMARFELFAGEPIRAAQLAPAGSSYLSAILGKGMRAVSVTVAADSASGGFIGPNDHVDVLMTRSDSANHDAQTILGNVRVLAINAKLAANGTPAGSGDASADVFSGQGIATLELDPTQAEVIADASTVGRLSLVLRSTTDAVDPATAEERATNASIRLSSPFWTSAPVAASGGPPSVH